VADALTPPFLVAATVLCIAGAFKLRSPAGAARALGVLGLPARVALVRALAAGELALGVWCAIDAGRVAAGALAGVYAIFAAVAWLLARREAGCGCFGEDEAQASIAQSILSAALSLVALAAAVSGAHGLQWVLERPAMSAAVLVLGTAGAACGTVLAYTEMPWAWGSWSAQ
jgi:hypothetical protein